MANKKLTKRDHFNTLLTIPAVVENDALVAFIENELDLLNKKVAYGKAETPQQKANAKLRDAIAEGMEPNKLYTITELMKAIPACAELTNQKVTSLVSQLVAPEDGRVVRVMDKRKAYFKLS